MTATLGEFLNRAADRTAAAISYSGELPGTAVGSAFQQLNRLVNALARGIDDSDLPAEASLALRGRLDPDARTALDTRLALRRAAHALGQAVDASAPTTGTTTAPAHPVVQDLSAAADDVAAGMDLLQTHFSTDTQGMRVNRSYWAPVIAAPPLTLALASELAGQARVIAPWAAGLALTGPVGGDVPTTVRLAVHDATKWLWAAGAAMQTAHQPAPQHVQTLRAVPANVPPPHRPPMAAETVPELCQGISSTAERLRQAAQRFAPQARWASATTSASWRRAALASALTCHASETILRVLSERAQHLGVDAAAVAQLDGAAQTMNRAWRAWRAVVRHWDFVNTGITPGTGPTPTAAEFPDLALRAGRLAYRNPSWTPSARRASQVRTGADLCPDPSGMTQVVGAIHTAADALTRSAIEDREAALIAAVEHRLFVPIIYQPATGRVHRRYAPASRSRTDAVLAAYDAAVDASSAAAAALDGLARTFDTPTAVLAAVPRISIAPSYSISRKVKRPWLAEQVPVVLPCRPFHDQEGGGPSRLPSAASAGQLATDLLTEAAALTAHRREAIIAPAVRAGRNTPSPRTHSR